MGRLSQKLQLSETELRNAQEELSKSETIRQEIMTQLDQTRTELQKQVYLKLDLEQRLNKAKQEVKNLQDELSKMEAVKLDLEAKIRDLEGKTPLVAAAAKADNIELGQIVVNPSKPTQPLDGEVLVLNKEYNFAVVNLGRKDGLSDGDTIAIYENEKLIGEVKVEKLQDAMVAVDLVTPRLKDKLVEGHNYTFKVK
ncbi:MAG: hypothetical protein NC829_00015 [Candidatus Omnitrophica bacterium]|nr:hypothetical protein [Candidatus Omnitrophota bacterium]